MLEVADIVRLHGAAYRKQYGNTLNPDRNRALRDIAACRTPFFGGHIYQCDHCQEKIFSYHSCGNRSCPKCHQNQTERWLTAQRSRLLPCPYFLLTFTLPAQLRPLARSHPKQVYGLLMKAAAEALQALASDPSFVGARIGALAVLHTWGPAPCCFILTSTCSSPPEACLRTGSPGSIPNIHFFSFPTLLCRISSALNSVPVLKRQHYFDSLPQPSGNFAGSFIPNMLAVAIRFSTISAATSSASLSPTAVWNPSTTASSVSATVIIRLNRFAMSRFLPPSSFTDFFSTSHPKA